MDLIDPWATPAYTLTNNTYFFGNIAVVQYNVCEVQITENLFYVLISSLNAQIAEWAAVTLMGDAIDLTGDNETCWFTAPR